MFSSTVATGSKSGLDQLTPSNKTALYQRMIQKFVSHRCPTDVVVV